MATFSYTSEDGKVTVDRDYPMGQAPSSFLEGDAIFFRDFSRARVGALAGGTAGWPMNSTSLGCHPNQIEQFTKESREAGIPTDFTPKGDAILSDPSHRARYMKFRGGVDTTGAGEDFHAKR